MTPRITLRWGLAALLLAGVAACNGDRTVTGPRSFRVTLEVTDPEGQAVPGLVLGTTPDTPWYGDNRLQNAAAAAEQLGQPFPNPSNGCLIPFHLDVSSQVSLTVVDIEGTTVRTLVEEQVESGARMAFWNGHDDSGALLPSGVYTAHLVVRDLEGGAVQLDESRRMLLAMFDQMKLGPTDSRGRIVLDDKRLFPFLYGVPDMPAVDADGQVIGTISLGPTVRFYFTDPATGFNRRYDRDVAGQSTLSFVWNPPPEAK